MKKYMMRNVVSRGNGLDLNAFLYIQSWFDMQ